MKILLAAINAKFIHSNLALRYLKSISGETHDINIAEYTINQLSYDILSGLINSKPDILAFSVYIWNVRLVEELISDISKILPTIKIILGGPEVSYNPAEWLEKHPNVSYIVTNGGERAWLELLESNFSIENKILAYENLKLDELPFPYTKKNIHGIRMVYYESSRGCPFSCSYCLSSLNGHQVEYRSLDKVKKELDFFDTNGVEIVKFVDRTFNSSPKFARSVWEYIFTKKALFHFEINPNLLSQEDIELLSKSPKNNIQFELGIQSANPATLKEINRNNDWHKITENIKLLQQQTNIDIHLDLISGLPYDSYDSFAQSFNKVIELKPDTFQPGMLKVLKGTKLHLNRDAYQLKYQSESPYRVLQNKWISYSDLSRLYNIEHLVNNIYNSHKFTKTLEYLTSLFGSAFKLFETLEQIWQENQYHYHLKDWQKTAQIILSYIEKQHSSHFFIVKDCLSWDLIFSSNLRHYPSFLLSDSLSLLIEQWKKYRINHSNFLLSEYSITKEEAKNGLLFIAESEAYRNLHQIPENTFVLIIHSDSYPKPIYLNQDLFNSSSD